MCTKRRSYGKRKLEMRVGSLVRHQPYDRFLSRKGMRELDVHLPKCGSSIHVVSYTIIVKGEQLGG